MQIRRTPEGLQKLLDEIEGVLENQKKINAARPRRKIFGARISEDFGGNWKLRSICAECLKAFEPPVRVKNEGMSASYSCEYCNAINEIFKGAF